jgi:hypothetical protein
MNRYQDLIIPQLVLHPPQIRFNTLLNNQGVRQLVLAFVPKLLTVLIVLWMLCLQVTILADIYFVY